MTFLLWIVQFACEIGLTIRLNAPQHKLLRLLAGYAAGTDIVGYLLYAPSATYFYTYWTLRIIELNLAVAATCYLLHRVFTQRHWLAWSPLLWGLTVTVANWLPRTNYQMCIWETIMLAICGITAWLAVGLCSSTSIWLLAFAAGLTFTLQTVCTVLWRSWAYSADIWMITWIAGLGMLWWASATGLGDSHGSPEPYPHDEGR